jgi:hypothetical protein
LTAVVVFIGQRWPAWILMWALALVLFAGCKWLTYREAVRVGDSPTLLRAVGFLFAWVGMDAKTFLNAKPVVNRLNWGEWLFAAAKTGLGLVLLSVTARTWAQVKSTPQPTDLVIGWAGMFSAVFLLHFGFFHLLALAWRAGGVNARPLMQNPLRAVSLAEFWGARWNTAFHELAHRFAFRPLAGRVGVTRAILLVFLLSGAVHELVISLPARGGYGLPAGYFLLQGIGVIIERTIVGQRIGLANGWRGWLFTLLFTAAPAFWLFHPPFIRNVILPMLDAMGAYLGKL